MPLFTTTGLFSTPSAELYDLYGVAYSAEQKLSHIIGGHNVKWGSILRNVESPPSRS